MPDTITITDLEIWTKIGVPDSEREKEQRLLATIEITTDAVKAGQSDDIADTIDYEAVASDIRKLAKTERKTIERFAEDIASHILDHYKPEQVCITVLKFALPGTKDIAVSIERP